LDRLAGIGDGSVEVAFLLRCTSPLLALSGHPSLQRTCPLSGVKQT
jgi:hypothetical protein